MRPLIGFSRPPPTPDVTVEFVLATTGAGFRPSLSSHTFSSFSLGTLEPGRRIVIAVLARNVISSVTVGGNAATAAGTQISAALGVYTGFFTILDDTNLTADIVVNLAGATTVCDIVIWSLYNTVQGVPGFFDSDSDTSNFDTGSFNVMSVSMNVPLNGVVLAYAQAFDDPAQEGLSFNWLEGVDENFDFAQSGNDTFGSSASRKYGSAVNNQTVSVSVPKGGGVPGNDGLIFLICTTWGTT